MKYVILMHSSPQPWGHPTSDYLAHNQDLPEEVREQQNVEFDAFLTALHESGELLGGEALADPRSARLLRWVGDRRVVTDGPYAETKEQFAGFFLIDAVTPERAEEIAQRFSGPGETVELRAMWPGGTD